jgi:site-specific recombinase XerD
VVRRTHEALLSYRSIVRPDHEKDAASDDFFLTARGDPLTLGAVQQMTREVGQAAEVPLRHVHPLRHTSATQNLVNGGDAISLQHRLGHSGLEMTNGYVHFASA